MTKGITHADEVALKSLCDLDHFLHRGFLYPLYPEQKQLLGLCVTTASKEISEFLEVSVRRRLLPSSLFEYSERVLPAFPYDSLRFSIIHNDGS